MYGIDSNGFLAVSGGTDVGTGGRPAGQGGYDAASLPESLPRRDLTAQKPRKIKGFPGLQVTPTRQIQI